MSGGYSSRLATVLHMLLGGSPAGALLLDGRTPAGIGHQAIRLTRCDPGWLPGPVLRVLEDGWHLRVRPAVCDESGAPVTLSCLFVYHKHEPVLTEQRWTLPDEAGEAAYRLSEFPLVPTAVIYGFHELVAFWRLTQAIDLRRDRDQALDLQKRLAHRLGASVEIVPYAPPHSPATTPGEPIIERVSAYDWRSFVPLGGVVRGLGASGPPTYVQIADLDSTRVYALDELERAIADADTPSTPSPRPRRRRGAQESHAS